MKRGPQLLPESIATRDERLKADDKTIEQATRVKAFAGGFKGAVSSASWTEARAAMGLRHDRKAALQVISAATGYQPHPKQLALHLQGAGIRRVHKFFCAGIGTGKSHAGVVEDMICTLLLPGTRGLVIAPTYDQVLFVLLPTFLAVCEQMERAGFPILKRFRWSQMRAEIIGGGEVFFRSANKVDNLLGFQFSWVHFDESETVADPERVWDVLSGRVRQNAPFRQMLATSTPRGLRGIIAKFHRAREDCADDEREAKRREWVFVRATTFDNPYLPEDYIPTLRATYSKRAWDQEVMAKILRPATAVFPEFSRDRHSLPNITSDAFIRELIARGISYDLAYDAGDQFPHVLWIARFANNTSVIFDEVCDDGMTLDRLHKLISDKCARLKRPPEMIVCDRARKDEIQWAFHTFPSSVVERMRSKDEQLVNPGIEVVRNRLDPYAGDPKIRVLDYLWDKPPRRGIVNCLANLRYPQRIDGTLMNSPLKDNVHDHGVDALRMHEVKLYGEGGAMQMLTARYAHAA